MSEWVKEDYLYSPFKARYVNPCSFDQKVDFWKMTADRSVVFMYALTIS